MMLQDQPIRYRSKTREAAGWWQLLGLGGHAKLTNDEKLVEFAGLEQLDIDMLDNAGITCQRLLRACPNWMLISIPLLGSHRLERIRRVFPFNPNALGIDCPADPLTEKTPYGGQ